MHFVSVIALVALCLMCMCSVSTATQVSQCNGGNFDNLQERIKVGNCKKPPCKLRKKTNITVDIKFTPETNIKNLQTNVYAEVLGLPLPFVGVDGLSACDKIYAEDGVTKAPCPLKAGTNYLYKNSFPILEFYPRVSVEVHWSLSEKGKDIICFEVPARIQ